MIVSLFTNKDDSQIFKSDGTEITNEFFAQHQSNYDAGNYSAIIQDFQDKRLAASYPYEDNGVMPMMTVNYSGTKVLAAAYTYNNKTYTYQVGIKVTGLVNDYNFYFQTLNPATKTSFYSGGSPATLSKFQPYGLDMNAYLGEQFITIGLNSWGSVVHQWGVTANAKTGTVSAALLP